MRTIEIKITRDLWQKAVSDCRFRQNEYCNSCVVAAALSEAEPNLWWSVSPGYVYGYQEHHGKCILQARLPEPLTRLIDKFDTSQLGGLAWFDFHYPNGASFILSFLETASE